MITLLLCVLLSAPNETLVLDDAVDTAAASSSWLAPPRLSFGFASRLSRNLTGSDASVSPVSAVEWWNLGRLLLAVESTANLSAVFEGWVRWGAQAAPNDSAWLGFRIDDAYWQSDVQMREAYASWNWRAWSLRAGQRVFVWGKSEWGAPADVLNPLDARYDLFAALSSPKDARVPVWALDAVYHASPFDLQMVVLPFFTPHRVFLSGHDVSVAQLAGPFGPVLDTAFSPLSPEARDAVQQGFLGTALPSQGPSGASVALRGSGTASGWDLAGTAYYGWDRTPWVETNPFRVDYRRSARLALEAETEWAPFVVRVELGYSPGQTLYTTQLTPVFCHTGRLVVGADYTRGEQLFVSISAYTVDVFSPPDAALLGLETTDNKGSRPWVWIYGFIGNVRWVITQPHLEVRATATAMPKPGNYVAYAQLAYTGWEPHNLALGALLITGKNGSVAGDYAHNKFVVLQYQSSW